ncbi:unnamed protein product [Phaedon cochleariae]|uniref:G patch domain-containing protein n=1 Tax=Phaedon cochleariae TaxID=80249 RepID=A0A9P0DZA1_PHACE|nr:unnamed protein product [Phaedon cochleariae]
MSESEEENFCYFGKPLDPYDEDAFPKRRPITVEEQIATDAQGRRRFHGAFTGGFSAGFFNTVGSLEGWTPSEFKSTRQEKARGVSQKPEDFMDEEDLGEYGIAPQVVRATKDYSTSKKRRKQVFSEGPIPGQPVLETLLTSGNETVGYLLLKNIGLKEKIEKHLDEVNSASKTYGCQMPVQYKIPTKIENKQYQIPDIYKECLEKPKSNTFGLDYKGLDRSHVNLFRSSNLVVTDRNNKKFSIGGQAFGVGAFEEDDDDIYMREDMSNYDHELIKEKCSTSSDAKHGDLVFGMFVQAKNKLIFKKVYPPPTIPHSFIGKHKVKKSRFEPLAEETEEVDRARINPNIRAKYLGEETPEVYTQSQPIQKKEVPTNTHKNPEENKPANAFSVLSLMSDRFVSASQKEDVTDILEPVEKSETTHGTKDMREAARMKMFGRLTRVTLDWRPCSCLCKRFNVPEPFMDRPEEKNRKRTKNLIFENQKHVEESIDSFKPGVTSVATETKEEKGEEEEKMPDSNQAANTDTIETPEIKIEIEEASEDNKNENETKVEPDSTPKDITDKIGIEEKTDLFKAVFLSSSESEDEEEEEATKKQSEKEKTEEFKEALLSDQLIPKIKPLKEGILSNLNFHQFSIPKPPVEKIEAPETDSTTADSKIVDSYGPQLPSEKPAGKTLQIFKASSDSDDEWIEKDDQEKKKKSKHKKKNKKKDRHKHKKDKKSKK